MRGWLIFISVFSISQIIFLNVHIMHLNSKISEFDEILQRADQSCADLENRYNYDVNTYWNPLVQKFNYQTTETTKILNQHADIINEQDERITEVEKRRFF